MIKTVRLKKDLQERFTAKRAWYANAWRLILTEGPDAGQDAVQPWFRKRKEAIDYALDKGWSIVTDD